MSELLAALAIMALVTSSMTAGIGASMRVYQQSVAYSESQTLSSTLSQAIIDELRYAKDIQIADDGTVLFTSAKYGAEVSFGQSDEGYLTLGDNLLITDGAYSSDRISAAADVAYHADTGLFDVTLHITDTADTSADAIQTVTFSVRPLNTVT